MAIGLLWKMAKTIGEGVRGLGDAVFLSWHTPVNKRAGSRGYVDNLLYSIANSKGLKLLTADG